MSLLLTLALGLPCWLSPQDPKPKFSFRIEPRKQLEATLGEEALEDFDRAVKWTLNRQQDDGRWPGAEEDAVANQALALLLLMGGALDTKEEVRTRALDKGFVWLESHLAANLAQDQSGSSLASIPLALAAWALLEGDVVARRPGTAGKTAMDALARRRLENGAFPAGASDTTADAQSSALAIAVLSLGVEAKVLKAEDLVLSHDWLRAQATNVLPEPFREESRALVAGSLLSSLFLQRFRGDDQAAFWKLGQWLGEHPPTAGTPLLGVTLGTLAALQLGKPHWQPWNAFQRSLGERFETTGKEKGAARASSTAERTPATLWLALTLQASVRFEMRLARR